MWVLSGQNPSPLQNQPVPLATEPSLQPLDCVFKKQQLDWTMAHQLRVLTALTENPIQFLEPTQLTTCNSNSRGSDALFQPPLTPHTVMHIHSGTQAYTGVP